MGMEYQKTIWLPATMDTKGEETMFLAEQIRSYGPEVKIVDVGILRDSPPGVAVTQDEIARAAGVSAPELRVRRDRGEAVAAMGIGLERVLLRAHTSGRLDGVISVGGSGGASIATRAMRSLPVGVPKFMITTIAAGNTEPYIGGKDLVFLYPVTDILGLNRVLRGVLIRAAAAIVGMVEARVPTDATKPAIALTSFGCTTPCVSECRRLLEERGFEVMVFHARGTGGRVMEEMIRDRSFVAVLDITTTELADELVGGMLSAGPHRLQAAGDLGLPQVVVPGALDMVNFGARETVPKHFAGRVLYQHGPFSTLMRTTKEEMKELAKIVAQKLNRAKGPASVIIPQGGFSDYDRPGGPLYDPQADAAFTEELEKHLAPGVSVRAAAFNINDPRFAHCLVEELLRRLGEVDPGRHPRPAGSSGQVSGN